MLTKEAALDGMKMYHKRLKAELADNATVIVGKKSSTVEGAMWFTIDDEQYWSLYMCLNGARIEVAYGQIKSRN